ncbi:putative transcriptional regulator [Bacillus sp. TS-2]|nr:putative transcriptional regulator [Bacillus sp. TS-2]
MQKKAHVSQVTIYNYFENKHNLIHETYKFYIDNEVSDFIKLVKEDIPFPEKIKKLILQSKQASAQIHDEFYQYMIQDYSKEHNYLELSYTEQVLPYFEELIHEGKKNGFIDKQLSNQVIMMYIQMFAEYTKKEEVSMALLPNSEEFSKVFFYGLFGYKDTNKLNL